MAAPRQHKNHRCTNLCNTCCRVSMCSVDQCACTCGGVRFSSYVCAGVKSAMQTYKRRDSQHTGVGACTRACVCMYVCVSARACARERATVRTIDILNLRHLWFTRTCAILHCKRFREETPTFNVFVVVCTWDRDVVALLYHDNSSTRRHHLYANTTSTQRAFKTVNFT